MPADSGWAREGHCDNGATVLCFGHPLALWPRSATSQSHCAPCSRQCGAGSILTGVAPEGKGKRLALRIAAARSADCLWKVGCDNEHSHSDSDLHCKSHRPELRAISSLLQHSPFPRRCRGPPLRGVSRLIGFSLLALGKHVFSVFLLLLPIFSSLQLILGASNKIERSDEAMFE